MTIEQRNSIFEENRNLIYFTIRRNRSLMEAMRMEFDDLAQELACCLLCAIERYDPTRGAKPSTYYFKALRYGMLDLWRAQIRQIRLANMLVSPLTWIDKDGEEIVLELPVEVDYDTDLFVKEFLQTLSLRERYTLAKKVCGMEPEDKRHQRFMNIIKRKALRYRAAGGAF